jgi:hypothetical protein
LLTVLGNRIQWGSIVIENKKLSEDSTIYHYRLINRIRIKYEYLALYISCLLVATFLFVAFHNLTEIISLLLGYILIQMIHLSITSLVFLVRSKISLRNWAFQLQFPWVGFMPKQPVSMLTFTSVQLHLLFVGIAVIACFFPWATPIFLGNLIFLHLWILIPRFFVILFSRIPQSEMIKLDQKSISHYNS